MPRCFLELGSVTALARGLGHALPTGLEADGGPAATDTAGPAAPRPGRPARLVRSVLASRCSSDEFGPMVQQAAWRRNFFAAERRAFLGDGQACNWTIWRRHFPSFVAIVDFVHALSYIFAAALAGRQPAAGFAVDTDWIQRAWAGRVASILPELQRRAAELGEPPVGAAATDPRVLVSAAVTYLGNNAARMRYDAYRRAGLPIMTAAVESAIKRINRRVKGSEKFWSEPGAEAVLQLRADYLSETEPMEAFWAERARQATGFRPYRQAS